MDFIHFFFVAVLLFIIGVGLHLGMRSLLKASRDRSSISPLWENLSKELLKASQNAGEVIDKRYSLNKLAGSNKRRIHFGIRY